MLLYIAKRLLLAVGTLLVILFSSYLLLRLAPGDPARSDMMSDGSGGGTMDSKNSQLRENRAIREQLDLDKPILYGFARWLGKIVCHGDFGTSVAVDPGKPVTELIAEKLPVTVKLNLCAIILTWMLAIPIGVLSAKRAGSFSDRSVEFILFVLYSLPVMWVGLLLQSLFCEGGRFPLFPLKGIAPENPDALSIWQLQFETLKHAILPVFCLAYGGFAGLSRYARNSMLEILHSDYIRTAYAKGLADSTVTWRHGFGNALITMITLAGNLLPALVSGSVLVEYIFNIPGMGSLSLLSLSSRDYPLQMALFAFTGGLTLFSLLLCDLLYMWADPRVKL